MRLNGEYLQGLLEQKLAKHVITHALPESRKPRQVQLNTKKEKVKHSMSVVKSP